MSKHLSWDDQRYFLAVLEAGSLSGAARRLGVTQPTVRARIEALESVLGSVLFTRSVNGLTPTESARALQEPARAMALASARFVREASAAPGALAGTVRLSVPEFMGIEVLPPMLAELRQAHPAIGIELVLSNAPADLLAQEVDLAVRMFAPRQEALVAKKSGVIGLGFFASPAYLERRGRPDSLADLAQHDMIGPDRNRSDWALAETVGLVSSLKGLALRTDSHVAQLAAARAGLGIAVAQIRVAGSDAGLVRVLPELRVAEMGVWLVMHENLRGVPRVKAVFDALSAELRRFAAQN